LSAGASAHRWRFSSALLAAGAAPTGGADVEREEFAAEQAEHRDDAGALRSTEADRCRERGTRTSSVGDGAR